MSFAEVLSEIARLTPEQRQEVLRRVADADEIPRAESGKSRRPGLHAGAWQVAEDFDAPLPDEFWMGGQA